MFYDVYADRKRIEVMRETWGHLAPVPRRVYAGFVIFSVSPNGDHNLLDFDFGGLDGNPWTFEHVSDWWSNETNRPVFTPSNELVLWRWSSTYMVQKNEVPRFKGRHIRMMLIAAEGRS